MNSISTRKGLTPKGRPHLMLATGIAFGLTVLGSLVGCGSTNDRIPVPAAAPALTGNAADPIWGTNGPATAIINSLSTLTTENFPTVDYDVTAAPFNAVQCGTIPFAFPYTQAAAGKSQSSPISPGSTLTNDPARSPDARPAFTAAIIAANAAGGGRVVVPSGTWYCAGPIVLLSNVNFHLSANCTIFFSPNPADYAKDGPYDCTATPNVNAPGGVANNGKLYDSRWQANDCLNFGSPVYAYKQTNIALTGDDPATSILNGQYAVPYAGSGNTASSWWTMKGSNGAYGCVSASTPSQASTNPLNVAFVTLYPNTDPALLALLTNTATPWAQDQNYLPALSELKVPYTQRIFGLGHYLRPSMVEFLSCKNVLMQGYQTNNTPFWQHHPTNCDNVRVTGVFANSIGANNDGFDPDACRNVLIDEMTFNTGDDCIAVKSAKDLDTEYGPASDHVIINCVMNSGHGGITFGSEMGAGVQNMYARNLSMLNQNYNANPPNPLNIAIRIKTNLNRGGFVKNIYVDNVQLPNGVNQAGGGYGSNMLPGSPITAFVNGVSGTALPVGCIGPGTGVQTTVANPAGSNGGLITFDCDYQPSTSAIRVHPPQVSNVNISNVVSGTPTVGKITGSCFQAIVAQGPVSFDYNGPLPTPTIYPITGVTITNCDFGTPVCTGPMGTLSTTVPGITYAYDVNAITLNNVKIGGTTYNTTLVDLHQ